MFQVIFDQYHRGPMPHQVNSAQYLKFKAFNINGYEIQFWVARLGEHFIQSSHFPFFLAFDDDVVMNNQTGQNIISACYIYWRTTALFGCTERALKNPAAVAMLSEQLAILCNRLHKYALPTVLFKQPCLAQLRGMICTYFQKKAISLGSEVFPQKQVFTELGIRIHSVRQNSRNINCHSQGETKTINFCVHF